MIGASRAIDYVYVPDTPSALDENNIRTKDKKVFDLPRRFDREICLSRDIKGFSMKSSCAPYKDCSRKQFLYNISMFIMQL